MNTQVDLFPNYIPRENEEQQILSVLAKTRSDRQSRAVFLCGPGGMGKTYLVRHLAENVATVSNVIWLRPIDVDDSEYWLLANLEREIAEELNKRGGYFQKYLNNISQMPRFEIQRVGHETVLTHLRKSEDVFYQCYDQYVKDTNDTPVIVLDTIESIRGTDMLLSLTQWIKRLTATFFLLAGRPVNGDASQDPLLKEFEDPYNPLPCERISLSQFSEEEIFAYFNDSQITIGLSQTEKEKLARLTRGHPLFLALTVYYLYMEGLPPEIGKNGVEKLKSWLPYQQDQITTEGEKAHEEFVRRLVVPYRETDFWHEAIKRLAVIRRGVNKKIWQDLMDDLKLPTDITDWDSAWNRLQEFPWIRPRANRNYITLHDGLAEELARRIIPLQDKNGTWRRGLWKKSTQVYKNLSGNQESDLNTEQEHLDAGLMDELTEEQQRDLIRRAAQLDVRRRELDQLKATQFYYQMLCESETGCRQFIALFDDATKRHQFRFRELLWLEIQRFLPDETLNDSLEDVIRLVVNGFREWFLRQVDLHYEIGKRGAQFLIDNGRPKEAASQLNKLLDQFSSDLEKQYELLNLRGMARMPIKVSLALEDHTKKLNLTKEVNAPEILKKRQGEALKDLGLYNRNIGNWHEAGNYYQEALSVTPFDDQVERASIQANWAYVQALRGHSYEALDLIEGALAVRHARNLRWQVGMALSIKGEVYRYARDWNKAWDAYQQAENIFFELANWSWLGIIRQEKAICLFQSAREGTFLGGYASVDEMQNQSRILARQGIDICEDRNTRAYPSALNRAGRIWGEIDPYQALKYLEDAIWWAKQVDDYWMWFASLIEYVELNYQIWEKSHKLDYRKRITECAYNIQYAMQEYPDFADLCGRWELIQGHLLVHDALENNETKLLITALDHYKRGFALIARGPIGSHGLSAMSMEFKKFGKVFQKLPIDIRKKWCEEFREAWNDPSKGYITEIRFATPLNARLTELYEQFVHQQQAGGGC